MTEPVRVLFVDDDPAFAERAAAHLGRRDGFEVDVESDPDAAFDRLVGDADGECGAPAVDCVVSDYDIGETTGIDLLRRVRTVDERLPFVLFAGRGSEAVASEAISEGVTDYIRKRSGTEQYELLANRVRNAVEHYRTERRLRESEQLYRTVVERSHDAIYVYQDDRFLFANRRACELTGYDEEQLAEKDIWELVHPEDRERVRGLAAKRARNDPDAPSRYTARIVTRDGTVKRCQFSVRRIRYEGERAILGSVREMSAEERVEERFQALIERSSDLVTIVGPEGIVRYQSPSSERILGTDPDVAVGTNVLSFVHPEDRNRVEAVLDHLYDAPSTSVETLRFRVRHDDGSWVWLEAVARADPVESIDGIVVNSRDVTERRAYEQRLHRYESIVRNIKQGAYIVGTDGRFEFVNHVVESRTGMAADELVGRDPTALRELGVVDDAGLDAVQTGIERVLSGDADHERVEIEVSLPTDVEYVEVVLSPLRDVRPSEYGATEGRATGDVRGVVGLTTDITDRKRYEDRLSALHSASRELTVAATYEEVAEIMSDAAENILNYPLNGVLFYEEDRDALMTYALSDAARKIVEDVTLPRGEGIGWRVFENGEGEVFGDVSTDPDVRNPDTEVRSEVILPIGDYGVLMAGSRETGKLNDSRVSLSRILTSNASAALERVEREQLLRRRERELQHQNEQLEQVASVVSHDLRNPLNVASGQLQLLRSSDEVGGDDVEDRLDRIESAHERMRRIIEDMLNLARHGQPVEELETVLLGGVARASWQTVDDDDAELVISDDLGTVAAHEGRLKQLFENLFRNAVEHNAPGDPVTVRVGQSPDGFYVEDDGVGIPEDDRDGVFEPGVSTDPDGTGLGLGIVRTIAHAHGWTVDAAESESGGARFEIRTADGERTEP